MVLFVAWVSPWWGLCAAISAYHWLRRGWQLVEGSFLWPVMAMALWLGVVADSRWLSAGLALALALGVLESVLATLQWTGLPYFTAPGLVTGTIGHRTGLGMYLAFLLPLGFLTDWGVWLAACYLVGLLLARSAVAWAAALVGMLVLAPRASWVLLPCVVLGVILRAGKWRHGRLRWRHLGDSWRARWTLWRVALRRTQPWPAWLIGHGVFSFAVDARLWIGNKETGTAQLSEAYYEAHNDYIEFTYEHGALGCAAMLGWLASLTPAFAWRDPVTGAAAAIGVAMLGQFPLRVAPVLGVIGLVAISLVRRL